MSDLIDRQAAIDAVSTMFAPTPTQMDMREDCLEILENLPSAQPQSEWNNHTVACLLAELFGDDCACNYNGIDACPNPVGVACWEQFLKHRAERRTE